MMAIAMTIIFEDIYGSKFIKMDLPKTAYFTYLCNLRRTPNLVPETTKSIPNMWGRCPEPRGGAGRNWQHQPPKIRIACHFKNSIGALVDRINSNMNPSDLFQCDGCLYVACN